MPSFDIVSKVEMQEIDNAVNQAVKEIEQRFDFKGTHNEINLEKDHIMILAAEGKLPAVVDILRSKLAKRGISPKSLEFGKEESASGNAMRQRVDIMQGIPKEKAKDLVKFIKDTKLKVQAQIMDDQVRVSGKKIDDLQEVIQALRGAPLDIEMQYVNMRS